MEFPLLKKWSLPREGLIQFVQHMSSKCGSTSDGLSRSFFFIEHL